MKFTTFLKSLFRPSMGRIYLRVKKNIKQLEECVKANDELNVFKAKKAEGLRRDCASLSVENAEMKFGIEKLNAALGGRETNVVKLKS